MPASSLREAAHAVGTAVLHRRVQRRAARARARRACRGGSRARTGRGDTWPTTRCAARLRRGHRVEQVVPDAGIVERVEHGPDHDRLAARRRELFVPLEVGEPLLAVEEQRARRHREQARARDRRRGRGRRRAARRRRTPGRGARCCPGPMLPTTWSVEKPSAPRRSPSATSSCDRRDLVGVRRPARAAASGPITAARTGK